jgi:two-component system, OmpR family, sensor kinase
MSLRARLLAGILVLISVALAVAAVSIYEEQRSFLRGRLDRGVIAAVAPISYQLGVDARLLEQGDAGDRASRRGSTKIPLNRGLVGFLPSGTYGVLIGSGGKVLRGPVIVNYGDRQLPGPVLPSSSAMSQAGRMPQLLTVGSRDRSSLRYRMAAVGLASGSGTLIVAVPLREVDQTLDRLVIVELVVVAIVILVLMALGWIVIRIALRPLDHMGAVASAIADGHLSRRVSPATSRTEVGRLGMALNKMLARINQAFADREKSEERQRQFLSDASHELRTPLASIRGYTELFRLGATEDPEALRRAMARIEAEATRMGVLVEDLLTLARLDEFPEARQDRVDFAMLGANAAADARAMAPDRTITFQGPGHLDVLGDPNALRQVLANLLGNAVIHTPAGTAVEVSVYRQGSDAVLKVRDHGPGLPPGAEVQAFERFWRADGGRARGRGASGLGLAIVREIVASHHGSVRAVTLDDGGAVFTVRLPALPSAPAAVADEPPGDPVLTKPAGD